MRLDVLAHGKPVDALARLVARSEADSVGRSIIAKMKSMMERQQFDVILQVLSCSSLTHVSCDVTSFCCAEGGGSPPGSAR